MDLACESQDEVLSVCRPFTAQQDYFRVGLIKVSADLLGDGKGSAIGWDGAGGFVIDDDGVLCLFEFLREANGFGFGGSGWLGFGGFCGRFLK